MEIPRHTSLYWEMQIISLAVEAISFLDILIVLGKIGRGKKEGRSCPATALPYSQVYFVFMISYSWATAWALKTAEANFLVKYVNGTQLVTYQTQKALKRPLYSMLLGWSVPLGLPVCSVVANTPDWGGGGSPSASLSC